MTIIKCGQVLGAWFREIEPLFPVPQLHQVLQSCVSKSTGLTVNRSCVLVLHSPTCVTLSFQSQFSHLQNADDNILSSKVVVKIELNNEI